MSSGLGMATKRSHDGETKQQLQQQHHFQQQQEGGNNNNIQQRSQHPQQHERRRPSGERDKPTTAPNTSTISQEKDGSGMVSAENNTMSGGDVRTPNSAAGATEQVSRKKGRPKSPVPKNGKSEKGIGDVSGSGSGKNQQQEQQETVTPDSNGNNAVVSNISSNDNNGNCNDNSGSPENGESPAQHLAVAATTAATTAASSGAATASTALVAPPSPAAPLTITAEEVNFLIYRYLQESGFVHSSFTFAHESLVGRTRPRNAGGIPPGALILFLQKGLQYVGMEECVLREMEGGAVAATAAVVGGTAAGGGTDGATNAAVTGDEDKDGDNGKLIALRPNKKAKASSSSSSPLHSHSSNDKDKEQGGETTPTNQAAAPASDITTFLGPDFTLLCPRSLHTLTRKDPPIKLRVPPASAAAAIKARMEMEEKLARERRAMELEEEKERRKRKKMLREESGLIIASGAGAAKDAMSYAVVGEDLAGEAMAVDEKKSERKKKSQAARAGEAAGPADHGTGKGAKSKKAKAAAAAAVNHANAAMEEAQEIEEHVPTPKKKKKKKKNAILAAEEEEPPSQADQQQPLAQQQPQNVSLEKSTASKEKPKTLPSPGMSSQKATPMDMDELETSSLASAKQRQKQSDFQLQQQQQQQQAAMNMANKGQGSGAANSSMSQIEATAAAMRAAASKGGIFPHGITTSLNQLNASKGQGPNSLSNTPSIDQKHRSSSVDNNPHSSRGGTPTVNAPGPGGPNIAGFNMHAMHQRQQELREMEIAAAKRMQEAQRFQDPQRFQEAQRMQQEAQAGLHRLQQERQMWEMQQQQQQGGNVNRGSGMGGSSERGGLPQAYQSMDVDAAEVARQRAELQAVLAQRHQAVHAMAQGGGGNGAGGGSGRDSQQQPQQQKSHQGREDDSARANAIAALMSAAASGNVSAEEAVSRMGAAAAAMGNSRPGMQNYPADGPNSNGVGMVNAGNNGKNTPMDGGQPPGKSSMGGMGSKKIVNLDQRNSVSSSDAAGQSAASIEEEDMLTSIHPSEVMELSQHTSEVFMCAWNPRFTNLIATGSGDASARIWAINGPNASTSGQQSILLPHGQDPVDRKNKDVTTLEWSSNGELLATGSYDGVARVWSRNGDLRQTLRGHRGPIFSLKWNKRGNFLLSGSYDKSTIVWDVSGDVGFVKQQFSFHFAPALDVDWKDDLTFASCSTDKTVQICRVGLARPIKTYTGHADEVNAVKWDPSGTLLASCSDDCTAKVWDVNSPRNEPKWDFKSHQQEIYTVKWSPTGPGSRNPNKLLMLATASFDGSVRLWNVLDGTCLRILSRHRESVYSVAFSPSGDFLASGSLAGQLYIWNVRDGVHIKSFKGKGDIFEVAWNLEESRVAACFSSNVVSVIDFKRP